jgi:hypothetical protein
MLVIEDACRKYACACKIRTATKPVQPIEKSTYKRRSNNRPQAPRERRFVAD